MLRHSSDSEPGNTRKRGPLLGLFRCRGQAHHRPRRDRPVERDRPSAGLYRRLVLRRSRTGISRPPASMPAGASNIAITPTSARGATPRNIDGLLEFGKALPKLRRRGRAGPQAPQTRPRDGAGRNRRLLDTEYMRIGNEQYAKGQQELRRDDSAHPPRPNRKGVKLMMRFVGKHGIVHEVKITDANLKRIVKTLPGAAGPDAVSICER